MNEIWKPIESEPGYSVSNQGRIRNDVRGNLLKPYVGDRTGHLRVDLSYGRYAVHRLVAWAFIGPAPDGTEVCHNNNIPDDNRAVNLRWGTRSENMIDLRQGKTTCKNGHPWNDINVYTDPNGWQSCRTCRRIARAKNRRKPA